MLLMKGAGRRSRGNAVRSGSAAATPVPRVRPPLRARAPRLHAGAVGAAATARALSRWSSPPSASLSCLPVPGARPRLLPERRCRADPPAHARADRHAHRGDRAPRRRGRGGDPRADPAGPARDHPRQPRRAQQRHQPVVQQRRHDRHARRRDPAVAARRPPTRPSDIVTLLAQPSCRKRFPGIEFFFQPADIVTQILNFGLPAAIDVQFSGNNVAANAALAGRADARRSGKIPGAVDAHVHQRLDAPAVNLQMDRTRLQQFGLTAVQRRPERADLAVGQLADGAGVLAQSAERRGLQHRGADAAVQASTRSTRCSTCRWAPVAAAARRRRQRQHATARQPGRGQRRVARPAVVSRYNILPAIDVYVSVQGTDLASVAGEGRGRWSTRSRPKLPRGSQVVMRGQVRDDAGLVHRPRRRAGDGDRAGVPADRRQLPVVDRRGDHHRRRCRRRWPASRGCCSSPAPR